MEPGAGAWHEGQTPATTAVAHFLSPTPVPWEVPVQGPAGPESAPPPPSLRSPHPLSPQEEALLALEVRSSRRCHPQTNSKPIPLASWPFLTVPGESEGLQGQHSWFGWRVRLSLEVIKEQPDTFPLVTEWTLEFILANCTLPQSGRLVTGKGGFYAGTGACPVGIWALRKQNQRIRGWR